MTTQANAPVPARPKRPLAKILLIVAGAVVGLGAIGVLLTPTIAGSIGPGMIESAASKQIKGSVKVGKLSVGWFSDTSVGPVEVRDPSGRLAAKLDVTAPVSLWKVVSESWWSAKRLNVGTVQLAGMIDLERDASGKTNLEAAVEPKQPATPQPAKPQGGGLEALKAGLKITNLDIALHDKLADGTLGPDMGVKNIKGDAEIEFGGPALKLLANLTGAPASQSPGGSDMRVKVDAQATSTGPKFDAGAIDKMNVKADVAAIPVAVVDALADMRGALVEAMGDRMDLTADASGNLKNADIKASLNSAGVTGVFDLTVRDGVLTASAGAPQQPGAGGALNTLNVRSTAFLAKLPQTRDAVARAAQQVRLSSAPPALQLAISKLRLPLPAKGAGADPATLDARGMGLSAVVHLGAVDGQIATDPAAPGAVPASWRTFHVEPTQVTIAADDLSAPVRITGGTSTTLDGQSAGSVAIDATLTGLLDAQGRIKAAGTSGLIADRAEGAVAVTGMSTALLQPLIAGMDLPLDMQADVGPTLDANLRAKADLSKTSRDAFSKGTYPPADVSLNVQSANVKMAGDARIENNQLTTGPQGLVIDVNAAAGAAQRLLTPAPQAGKPAEQPSLQLSGVGRLNITIRDLAVALDKLKGEQAMANLKAQIAARLSDLSVKPAALGASVQPLEVQTADVNLALAPGTAPKLTHAGQFRHQGQNFASSANVTLDGLKDGKIPSGGGLDALFRFGASGNIAVENLPRSVLAMAPGAESILSDQAAADSVSGLVRGAIGRAASLNVSFHPVSGGGTAAKGMLSTEARGVSGQFDATVTKSSATISSAQVALAADPNTLNPVLAQNSQPGTAPMRVAQPFTVTLKVAEPITVPLAQDKDGALAPDFAKAGNASVTLKSDNEIVLDNVGVGSDAQGRPTTTQIRVRNLDGAVTLPLSSLASGATAKKDGNASFVAQVLKDGGAKVADVNAKAALSIEGKSAGLRSADVRLTGVDVKAVDAMLNQGGMLTGAVGDTAEVVLSVTPQGESAQRIDADINAPRLKGAKIALSKSADQLTLLQPASITWSPDAAFVSKVVFKSDQPGSSLAITQLSPVSIQLSRLTLSNSKEDGGRQVAGPMKPGVFALEATVNVPSMSGAVIKDADKQAPATIAFQNLRVGVRSGADAGSIDGDLNIQSVSSGVSGAPSGGGKAATAKLRVEHLADSAGVINAQNAVYSLDADLSQFPTAIVDQLGKQHGVLLEALGPTIDLKAVATNVSLAPAGSGRITQAGVANIKASSARANAELVGDLRDGVFAQTGAASAKIVEIRPELVQTLSGGLPLIQSVEKSTKDAPAVIDAQQLSLPLDGDMRKLSGVVRVDPGVARFVTQNFLGDIISLAGLKTTSEIGQRIEPFVVRISQGVATYDRFKLPIGQFSTETTGTVDLVNRQMDCVVYIPLGLLTDKAINLFGGGGLGTNLGVLDKLTMMPWSIKGPLDSPSVQPDLGRFAKETAGKVIKEPIKQIGDTLDKTIKDIFKPKDKTPDMPSPSSTPPPSSPAPAAPSSAPPATPPANPPANPPSNNPQQDPNKTKKPKKPKDKPADPPKNP